MIGAGASTSYTLFFNADTVDELNGIGTNVSFGVNDNGMSLGLSEDGEITSIGISDGPSVGSSVTVEVSKTETIFKFNPKEVLEGIWNKIKSLF